MNSTFQKIIRGLFAALCISIGLYPLAYIVGDMSAGLLSTKPTELLSNHWWNAGFYGHIVPGGIALFVGWLQFNKRLRQTKPELHRAIGKLYVAAVCISSLCGIGIGFFATGGLISSVGFIGLGGTWFSTTALAYAAIRRGNTAIHKKWMIYSYAACFAAVTLRIWLPLLSLATRDFTSAYQIVAWLCWAPNIAVAFLITRQGKG